MRFRSYSEGISIQNQIQVCIWKLIPDSESLIVQVDCGSMLFEWRTAFKFCRFYNKRAFKFSSGYPLSLHMQVFDWKAQRCLVANFETRFPDLIAQALYWGGLSINSRHNNAN